MYKNLKDIPYIAKFHLEKESYLFVDGKKTTVFKIRSTFAKLLEAKVIGKYKESDFQSFGRFYIGKQDKQRYWVEEEAKLFNNKVRPITFLRNKELRNQLAWVLRESKISSILNEHQYGFKRKQSLDMYSRNNQRFYFAIDLSNAFNCISKSTVYWTLRKAFDLKHSLAQPLTDSMCIDGYAYQGHPIFPLVFSVIMQGIVEETKGRFKLGSSSYADDITFFSNKAFSPKKQQQICDWLKSFGLFINEEKSHTGLNSKFANSLGAHCNLKVKGSWKIKKRINTMVNLHKKTTRYFNSNLTTILPTLSEEELGLLAYRVRRKGYTFYKPISEKDTPEQALWKQRRNQVLSKLGLDTNKSFAIAWKTGKRKGIKKEVPIYIKKIALEKEDGTKIFPYETALSLLHWIAKRTLDIDYMNGHGFEWKGLKLPPRWTARRNYSFSGFEGNEKFASKLKTYYN